MHRVGDTAQVGAELFGCARDPEPPLVHRRRRVGLDLSELFPVGVLRQHGEPRLRRAERDRLASVVDPDGEDLVLHLVLEVDELSRDETPFTRLAQAVQPLALDRLLLGALRLAQQIQLLAGEQIRVAGDDGRCFRALLLSDADGAGLFGPLARVRAERRLEFLGRPHHDSAHGTESTAL